ncbi:diguanylate cyclase [Cupriavidus sp. TA19]|uniref:diguanylate cyclase n=1 Tax=unclassified Cupriavidus TaxID=2640874 RepID=UPI000E2E4284|nr:MULTISPECIES: diguanylate cyclase [unclassified Cupriavidus]BDB25979.1 cellulose biosynthesis regulator YedQ [Cupriavidus sp. P-10]GLC94646.1 diguanylate cyclase [Cupriavidus sp. TA19]
MWRRLLPQPRWLPRLAVMRPQRVVLVCFGAVFLITLVVAARELYLVRERVIGERQHALVLRALGVDAILSAERRRLFFLRDFAEHLFALHANVGTADADIERAYAARNDEVWQLPLPRGDAPLTGVSPGSLAGLQGFARRDADLKADLMVGRTLSQLLGLGLRGDLIQGNALFISSNGFFAIYPQQDPARAARLMQRFDSMDYYRGHMPAQNPTRAIHWAPLYTEFEGARVLTTISIPVYAGSQFRGVIAVDVAQQRLHDLLGAASAPGTVQYMVNVHGDVVSSSGSGFSTLQKWPEAVPGDWSGYRVADLFARGSGVLSHHGDLLFFQRAGQSPWLVVDVLPLSAIVPAMFSQLSGPLLIVWLLLPLLLWVTMRVVTQLFDHYLALGEKLQELAQQDPLTGLANRRHFRASFGREARRQQRGGTALSLLMIDIDFFKKVNDRWGHASGDRVLGTLAQALHGTLRAFDLPARLGGEEFAVLLPQTALGDAVRIAERLREAIAGCRVEAEPEAEPEADPALRAGDAGTAGPERVIRFTISIGVAESPADAPLALDALLAIADRRLYDAKTHGRNRVVSDDGLHEGEAENTEPAT